MAEENERRVALITGSGKGVGAGIVRVFCSHGIRCCINYNSNHDMAEMMLKTVLDAGGEAFIYQADVADAAQVNAMAAEIENRYGRLDILVNNAAMQPNLYIDEYDADKLRKLWEINIGGYWRSVRACLPLLRKSPQPRIVNVSSIHGKRPTNFDAGYAMTKGAIRMFTRELAMELMPYGIPVNTIDLGGCRIEFKTGRAPFRSHMPVCARNPDGVNPIRQIVPEEVGALAYFLCDKHSDALNGDGIRMDAGAALL